MGKPAPVIDPQLCRACEECLARRRCKPRALVHIDRDDAPFVDPRRCKACYVCALDCPYGAVRLEKS